MQTLYVDKKGRASFIKPALTPIVGPDAFSVGNVTVRGVFTLEVIKWSADILTLHDRLPIMIRA